MTALLAVRELVGGYSDADILRGVSLEVRAREIVTIIGPNGAGKSTAMKAVFGLIRVRSGSIRFDGAEVTHWAPDRIVKRGVCFVPQVSNVFADMTVHENLEMGGFLRKGKLNAAYDRIYALFPELRDRRKALAGILSGGQRQMVAMGRAVMLEPKLLLLDEPTAGLSPKYIDQTFQICRDIRDTGVSILLVEQHAKQALGHSDRGYVLTTGSNRHEGTGAELLANREIADMFLGHKVEL